MENQLDSNSKARIESTYNLAKEQFAEWGVDCELAIKQVLETPISLHCWQGDDVSGFEGGTLSGGILATGNYPGRARTADELRSDLELTLSLLPGKHRLNLHAIYAEPTNGKVERNELAPEHFSKWMDWGKKHLQGLDFNPSFFSHPLAADGLTLTHPKAEVRDYWIQHGIGSRKIATAFGEAMGNPCVNNVWIPDGMKDTPADRVSPRRHLVDSLDKIFAEKANPKFLEDAVESKLFGIASESYVAGSHEFYLAYALQRHLYLCLDMGHFHPTEEIADKISSLAPFIPQALPGLLLHLSRGIRWDSDHVTILNDQLQNVFLEITRNKMLSQIRLATDFFDASIHRIGAWVVGVRACQKALLKGLLDPTAMLRSEELKGNYTARLALMEESKNLPFGAVWDMACLRAQVPQGKNWLKQIENHTKDVIQKRDRSFVAIEQSLHLNELLHISHHGGAHSDFSAIGGGNTSVKSLDGRYMFIKASGCSLIGMSKSKGYAILEKEKVMSLYDNTDWLTLSAKDREEKVSKLLQDSVIHPEKARPSVEAPLHAILGRCVLHTHDILVNALTCHNKAENLMGLLAKEMSQPPLWIPYVDPGATLAFKAREAVQKYVAHHKSMPQVLLLQNHGLFVSADTPEQAVQIHVDMLKKIKAIIESLNEENNSHKMHAGILEALTLFTNEKAIPMPILQRLAHSHPSPETALAAALTPDHIVYMGAKIISVSEKEKVEEIKAKIQNFYDTYHKLPRIFLNIDAKDVWVGAKDLNSLNAASEMCQNALDICTLAQDQIQALSVANVDFIVNWEAENYRAAQV